MNMIIFYNNTLYKMIYKGERVNKYIKCDGEIIQIWHSKKRVKEFTGSFNTDGYLQTNCNLYNTMRINRLVALLFIGNPPNDEYVVDHIDGNRKNNKHSNLKWCTIIENQNNPITRKRKSESKSKEKHPLYKPVEVYIDNKLVFYGGTMDAINKLTNELGYKGVDKWFFRGIPKKYKGTISIKYIQKKD